MFSRIRGRLTWANVAMTLALVFAMSGGAFAAGKYLVTSTKQIKPSVLAQLEGKRGASGAPGVQGPAGPQGPAGEKGAAGAKGDAGPEGKAGKDGATGESVVSSTLKAGEEGCKEGGSKFVVGAKTTTACNGAKGATGEPWTPNNALPSEATETGSWSFTVPSTAATFEASLASFAVQLPKSLDGEHVLVQGVAAHDAEFAAHCPGAVEVPKAEPGYLCIYVGEFIHANLIGIFASGLNFVTEHFVEGADVSGALGYFLNEAGENEIASGHGSWAATAE